VVVPTRADSKKNPPLLAVSDWQNRYENNRTRELKHMDWVPIPNQMDGDGFTELISHKNGAAHYGAWLALVLIASRCDVRGQLMRSCGRPHDAESLARISRISVKVFREALPRFLEIGWIENLGTMSHDGAGIPQDDATLPQVDAAIPQDSASSRARDERNGTERKGTEGNGRGSTAPHRDVLEQAKGRFTEVLAEYPNETGTDAACQFYLSELNRTRDPSLPDKIKSGIIRWKGSTAWRHRETGELQLEYIPAFHRFLGFPEAGKAARRMYLENPPQWQPRVRAPSKREKVAEILERKQRERSEHGSESGIQSH
jgi:hypothetical protein